MPSNLSLTRTIFILAVTYFITARQMSLFSLVNRYMNWRQQYCETTNISDLLTYICWVKLIKVSQVIWICVRTLLHEKIIDKPERYESVGKVTSRLILMKKMQQLWSIFKTFLFGSLWKAKRTPRFDYMGCKQNWVTWCFVKKNLYRT